MKVVDGINLLLNLTIQAQRVSALLMKAQLDGRYNLDPEEIKAIRSERDAAFDLLDQKIAEAEKEETSGS